MTLSDAIEMRFTAEDIWARRAVARLGDVDESTTIHDVAHGWLRFGGADGVLVDTLYVLTSDRLGFGQTTAETGQPVWVDLSSIRALDAIEGLPYPLQAVEVQLNGDMAMLVGWPAEFCEKVVDVLVASAADVDADDAELAATGDELTGPFADPTGAAGDAEVAELASLGPSDLVEGDVQPVPTPEPISTPVAPDEEFAGFGPVDPDLEDRVERFFLDVDHEPLPLVAADPDEQPADGDDRPAGTPSAFSGAGIQWPEPFRPVVYFGDHPEHPRRKKNVTLTLSPAGITAVASGMGTWKVHLPWDEVADLTFEHADEIKFTHNHRIHMNSTAMVVVLEDDAHMVFEIRGRRPAGLRSSLAPLLNALAEHRGHAGGSSPVAGDTFGLPDDHAF